MGRPSPLDESSVVLSVSRGEDLAVPAVLRLGPDVFSIAL